MKSKGLALALLIIALTASPASAYWIWTPKTGKWINPKHAVKPTPKEQFDYANSFYQAKKYQDAEREFKKLIKAYAKTREAAESTDWRMKRDYLSPEYTTRIADVPRVV